jgi:hypothetical protein
MIYGATYPGVPHLKNKYFSKSAGVASPKSTITGDIEPLDLSIMFYGFKSLCIILCPCICLIPESNPTINSLTSSEEKYPLFC